MEEIKKRISALKKSSKTSGQVVPEILALYVTAIQLFVDVLIIIPIDSNKYMKLVKESFEKIQAEEKDPAITLLHVMGEFENVIRTMNDDDDDNSDDKIARMSETATVLKIMTDFTCSLMLFLKLCKFCPGQFNHEMVGIMKKSFDYLLQRSQELETDVEEEEEEAEEEEAVTTSVEETIIKKEEVEAEEETETLHGGLLSYGNLDSDPISSPSSSPSPSAGEKQRTSL